MTDTPEGRPRPRKSDEYGRFESLTRRLVRVPKKEVKEGEAKDPKPSRSAPRK